jgi:ELWxxDGT repeat protein
MFAARGGGKGNELWRSNGTSSGTWRVRDLRAGSAGSDPAWLVAIDGRIYFSANDGTRGRELWMSDGTSAGTKLVKDIRGGSKGSYPRCFTPFQNAVYFWADTGAVGSELWRTNGTSQGTVRVKDIEPGVAAFNGCPVVFDGKLFFVHARDAEVSEHVLYVSDGTGVGTKPFKSHNGRQIAGVENITVVGSRLYFIKNNHLWVSMGTPATTRWISDVSGGIVGLGGSAFIFGGTAVDDTFTGFIWKSNGTSASTTLLIQFPDDSLNPGVVVGDKIFFNARTESGTSGLWTTDGTIDGTQGIDPPVRGGFDPWGTAVIDEVLYFSGHSLAEDAETVPGSTGGSPCMYCTTLWRTDGTLEGTYNLGPDPGGSYYVTRVGNSIYFVTDADGHGDELWRYVP